MKKLISLAAAQSILCEYGNMKGLEDSCRALGCDGYELIWGGEELPADLPADLTYGYHLTFFPDWLDFWRGDEAALKEKYGEKIVPVRADLSDTGEVMGLCRLIEGEKPEVRYLVNNAGVAKMAP